MTGYDNWSARGRAPDDDEAALRDALGSDAAERRREAALGLVDAAGLDDSTVEALKRRAERDPDPDVRQFAVEALGNAGVAGDAVESALEDDAEWVRAEAVVALSRVDGDATDRFRARLDDDSGWVRRNALVALSKTDAATPDLLRGRLRNDPHRSVREYAADHLGYVPGETAETVTLLAAVLARDPAALVRANAATSLGRLGTGRAVEALESQGLQDRSTDVQRAAKRAVAAAQGRDPDTVDVPTPRPPGGGPEEPVAGDPAGSGQGPGTTPRAVEPSRRGKRNGSDRP